MCSCTSKLALRVPRNDERGGPTREKQPDGQINNFLSIPLTKNIPLSPSGKSALSARPSRAHKRGVSRSSRTWGAGCGGRDGIGARFERADERCYCVRRSRVVLTPRRWCQVSRKLTLLGNDGDNKARSPGRVRNKP